MNIRAIAKQDDHAAAERETAYWYALASIELLAQRVNDQSRYCYINGQRCDTLDEVLRTLECGKRN